MLLNNDVNFLCWYYQKGRFLFNKEKEEGSSKLYGYLD